MKVSQYIKKIKDQLRKFYHLLSRRNQKKPNPKLKDIPFYLKRIKNKNALEIGGPSGIFRDNSFLPIYSCLKNVDGCNFSSQTIWEGAIKEGNYYEFIKGRKGHQYILDGTDLSRISSDKYDVILSSHSIEHIANPIKALKEWIRILKHDGYLLFVVPHKDGTFDHQRPVTSLEHIIGDYEHNIAENDLTHLAEVLELHDIAKDSGVTDFESFQERAKNNFHNRCLHHHVFDTHLILSLLHYVGLNIEKVDYRLPFNIIVLAKKSKQNQLNYHQNINIFISEALKISPFKTDELRYQQLVLSNQGEII